MFVNDLFNKKKLNESLRAGEYYTFKVFFDDGSDETLNFSGDDIDWDRVGARRGKQVVDVKRLGGIQGSQSDTPGKPHEYSDDRGLTRAQRAYDKQMPEGVAESEEISEDSIRPKLAAALKEIGFKGPFKLSQLPKWRAKLQNATFNENTSIMIGGNNPQYDPWVAKGYDYGYSYGIESGYQSGLSAQDVFKQAKQDLMAQDVAEGFAELDAYMAAKRAPKPKGGAGVKHGVYGTPERKRGRGRGPTGGSGSAVPSNRDFGRPRSIPRAAPMGVDDYDANYRREVDEGSVQDRLHRRHQELRKKSGLPDPDYYKELKASYDIEDDRKRLARQAEIKKKYRVAEALGLYGPFTVTINTGERPTSRTKTKKFRREDDAILWAEDWFEDFPQYVYATAEITDPEGNVVWYSDETMASGQGVAEAGPFSYGAKKPRKGSVADLAAKKRKEQVKDRKPIEPRDQMVGVAKVVTNEDRERYLDEMRRAGYDIVSEAATLCPECGGAAYSNQMLAEKQDACYHKVKSRYKVWPSAYASGALVRCRKVGAKNWGNKSKK